MSPMRVELAAEVWSVKGQADPCFHRGRLYRCGQCLYHFIPGTERPHRSEQVKARAVSMYSDGSSMETISRVMGVKAGTVYSWVKKSQLGLGIDWDSGGGVEAGSEAGPGHIL